MKHAMLVYDTLENISVVPQKTFYSFPDSKTSYYIAYKIDMPFGKYVVKWGNDTCNKYAFVNEIPNELKERLKNKKVKEECGECLFNSYCK